MKLDEGLTLIELLVVLVIVAIVSIIVTRALSNFIRLKDQADKFSNSFERLSKVFLIINQDIEQVAPIYISNNLLFDGQFVAFPIKSESDIPFLKFVKMSPDRLGHLIPPERVSYMLSNGKFLRSHQFVYEPDSKIQTDVLLSGVALVRAEYFNDGKHKWCSSWPCERYGSDYLTPSAMSLSLITSDGYEVHQVFLLPK